MLKAIYFNLIKLNRLTLKIDHAEWKSIVKTQISFGVIIEKTLLFCKFPYILLITIKRIFFKNLTIALKLCNLHIILQIELPLPINFQQYT